METGKLFAEELTRKKQTKTKRKQLVSPNQPWRVEYAALSSRRTDYRLHEFKLRWYFIGVRNIAAIKKILGHEAITPLNFKLEIEPFFMLAAKISLLLHRYLEMLPKDTDGKRLGAQDEEQKTIRTVRNAVAHGDMFWNARDDKGQHIGIDAVFILLMTMLMRLDRGREKANEFFMQMENLLRREDYAVADFTGDPPRSERVKKWSEQARRDYKKDGVVINKRYKSRKIVASWMRSLKRAGKAVIGLEKGKKNCHI